MKWGFWGSLVITRMAFLLLPTQLLGLSITSMVPSPPGGIVRSNRPTLDPQPGSTFLISSTPEPVFLILKPCAYRRSSDTVPKL